MERSGTWVEANSSYKPVKRATEFPYISVEDLVTRVPEINKKEIRALSLAGALNFEGTVHRRQALWESELAIRPTGELFENVFEKQATPAFINQMTEWQRMETDLMTTGITIGKHPMRFLREELRTRGVLAANQTLNLRRRDVVTVAGAVIVRQRPSTANDVVFITMEDETGYSNFIVMPDVFDKFRSVIVSSDFLLIRGTAEDGAMIKALYFERIDAFIAKIGSHDFQ